LFYTYDKNKNRATLKIYFAPKLYNSGSGLVEIRSVDELLHFFPWIKTHTIFRKIGLFSISVFYRKLWHLC